MRLRGETLSRYSPDADSRKGGERWLSTLFDAVCHVHVRVDMRFDGESMATKTWPWHTVLQTPSCFTTWDANLLDMPDRAGWACRRHRPGV